MADEDYGDDDAFYFDDDDYYLYVEDDYAIAVSSLFFVFSSLFNLPTRLLSSSTGKTQKPARRFRELACRTLPGFGCLGELVVWLAAAVAQNPRGPPHSPGTKSIDAETLTCLFFLSCRRTN